MGLINTGFKIAALEEAGPPIEMMDAPGMADENAPPDDAAIKAVKMSRSAFGLRRAFEKGISVKYMSAET